MSLTVLALALVAACNRDPAVADAPTPNAVSDAIAADPLAAPSDVKAPPADAQKSASGLAWKVLTPGTGATKPGAEDEVTVHYTGWTTDGKMFDSSMKRGEPATFPLNGVISGWTEGLQFMVEGEKRRFWIPVDLAYQGRPGKPAGMLVFDVELISIKAAPKPLPAPEDVAAAPGDASVTKSGLAYKTLTPGDGAKPGPKDMVKVHYTGWTTDGKMFDSSVVRGEPATFPLDKVIPGWTEGVQLIGLGGTTRIWVPEELAYKGKPGRPKGMLVFDVQLLEIIAAPKPPKDLKAPPGQRRAHGLGHRVGRAQARQRRRQARPHERREGALLGLDHRRRDVRLLRQPRSTHEVPAQQGHPRLDRGRSAHVCGREAHLLDPRGAGLQRQARRPPRHVDL
ncbi:MAG: FKBP-type peptidyl-prolyl cis-trans isomerase [Deltaproteobacteria bacterium]|nr:FKBP-type peptidyl-prolyl cis-trans isomerase [Deltaproteobacteria bacterium]